MPRHHLYDVCDKPACAGRSLDYERLPSCRSCQDRICRGHVVPGSIVLSEERFDCECMDCSGYRVEYVASEDTACLADQAAIRRSTMQDFLPPGLAAEAIEVAGAAFHPWRSR